MLEVPNPSTDEMPVSAKNDQRENQRDQHRHLHVIGFDLLAQVLRRAPDHQSGNEHRQHDVDQDAVEARAHSAENHLAEHDVDQRHHVRPAE